MQDRYAGDVGDFVKLGLLRAIAHGRHLGVAWYRYPDEGHNGDGRHTDYLRDRDQKLAQLDPELFQHLNGVVQTARSIRSLLPVLGDARSSDEALDVTKVPVPRRRIWRSSWLERVMSDLDGCDLVFADPDNGLTDDNDRRKGRATFGKSLPISEARRLSEGRTAVSIITTRAVPGGMTLRLTTGCPCSALRASRYGPGPIIAEPSLS
jgi:hypothetical protein